MNAGLSFTLLAVAVTAAAVLVTTVAFGQGLEGRDIPYGLAVFTVPALVLLRIIDGVLRAEGRFGAMNALELALPVSMLLCLGGVEIAQGLTVPRAVWAWSLAYAPPLLFGLALLGPKSWPTRPAPLSLLAKSLRFGGQSQLTNLLLLANYRLDVFMISILVNTAGVGLYTVASSQTEGLWIIANSVAIVFLTDITAGDEANSARLTPVVCRNTLLVTAVVAAGGALIAGIWIPIVFGSDYVDSVLPYLLLLPGTAALSGSKILSAYVFSRGRPIINAWIAAATLVATVPTDVALISLFGVPGAAAGTTLGYFLSLALTAVAYRALSGGSIRDALVPRRDDLALYVGALRSLKSQLRGLRAGALPRAMDDLTPEAAQPLPPAE